MKKSILLLVVLLLLPLGKITPQKINHLWSNPSKEAKPWVIWYWMEGAISKEGITADLEAMKRSGISGAYLMTIKGVPTTPWITPEVRQLTPVWWDMVRFAFTEADRLGIDIGFHVCDGFALAGGPWITPELSMQKVVWSKITLDGGKTIDVKLPQPESYKGYYKEIGVFAYPEIDGENISTETVVPKVTTSIKGIDPQFLADVNNETNFRSEEPCWIQYKFEKSFTCRTIQVKPSGNNLQAQRLIVEASDDGIHFRKVIQLIPPRHGWQNQDFEMTHSIPETTAKYFRFQYDKEGTEPGSEDLDAAKWKQSLKIKGIYMSSEARIHQYEGKTGLAWRISNRTTEAEVSNKLCIDRSKMIDITNRVDTSGRLNWKAPKGRWTILRMGHTSTGHTNATGGAGAGLECDKFNPEAIRLQFDSWFGRAIKEVGEDVACRVLKLFHIDSWECGSQNWSVTFRDEFKSRRGYDIYEYLPLMAGIPVDNVDTSERVLHDVRRTISELVADKFYEVLKEESHKKGVKFSGENVSPTMMSDGILHFKNVDIPMGEYWLHSPTHDKPNDMLDAISGAHIYEKNIVKVEAFTQLRTVWNETPAMVKALQDREYALGVNKIAYHVYVHNPWLDRKPGMTLDGIGFYFQRDQTWWNLGKSWVDYATRCQALLQFGKPVVDIAVYTGEEFPRRAMLPDRLIDFIPGIFGEEKLESERSRLANIGTPTRQMPVGVTHSSNITDASEWVNALRGYHYDSFNADALLRLASVKDGDIVLPGGMKYRALVVPDKHKMQPDADYMSGETARKIQELIAQGAKILIGDFPSKTSGHKIEKLHWADGIKEKVTALPYQEETFDKLGIARDFIAIENGKYASNIAYAHRQGDGVDIYFISNQENSRRSLDISLREGGRIPELWNPVTGNIETGLTWNAENGRTNLSLTLEANESVFVVLQVPTSEKKSIVAKETIRKSSDIAGPWMVSFDAEYRGPKDPIIFDKLTDWSESDNIEVKYYSGEAVYRKDVKLSVRKNARYEIEFDQVCDLAEVKINGKLCGTIWTKPYRLDITEAVRNGQNIIEVTVANTWANRIMGDEDFGAENVEANKIWTNARYRMQEKKLQKSGLIGSVRIVEKVKDK